MASVLMGRITLASVFLVGAGAWISCATVPEPKYERYTFPKNAFSGDVTRPYVALGPVRSKVDYASLDPGREELDLCRNYYNKSVRELLKYAHKQGADAVIDIQSVVFLQDGRRETYKTPECSDDGGEGQILTQGIAVKWKSAGAEGGEWTAPIGVGAPPSGGSVAISTTPTKVPAPVPSPAAAPVTGLRFYEEGVSEKTPELAEESAPKPAAKVPTPFKMTTVEPVEPEPERAPAKVREAPQGRVETESPAPAVPRLNMADPRMVPGFLP